MINQGDTSDRPLDIQQLKLAMRHGQKIDGLENIMLSSQPIMVANDRVDISVDSNSDLSKTPLHNRVLEEQIDQLGRSLNREIVSLKGEFAIVAQGTALEEQIDKLGQFLNQEIQSLKSELAIMAQDGAVEEEISKLGKQFSQEILSLRNEFAMFVQAQLNQEKAWKMAENGWKNVVENREADFQAEIREMQHNILGKFEEHFQHVDEQLQHNDKVLRDEVSLLISQLLELQQSQNSKEEVLVTEWHKKMEERQTRLIEDMDYIQYVLEEIATRPQSIEAQQKLREKFFIREIAVMNEKITSISQEWKSFKKAYMVLDGLQYNQSSEQREINLANEAPTQVYKQKRKRRH